jgi:hypothetical protein
MRLAGGSATNPDYDESAGMNNQLLLGEKLERAVPFHINGVCEVAVNGRKHGDDGATLMVVGCVIDLLANRKLRHRELLMEPSMRFFYKLIKVS